MITVSTEPQGDFSYVVCAYTEVSEKYRNRRNLVRQTFLHLGASGKLGEIRADTYANKRKPALFGYSLVPAGDKFVFKVKIEAGSKATGKVSFRVPAVTGTALARGAHSHGDERAESRDPLDSTRGRREPKLRRWTGHWSSLSR